jgi:hypothetical protein
MNPKIILSIVYFLAMAPITLVAFDGNAAEPVGYKFATIDGIEIFYREAGDPKKPTILLLHGFPSSSHMFRDGENKSTPIDHGAITGDPQLSAVVRAGTRSHPSAPPTFELAPKWHVISASPLGSPAQRSSYVRL